MCVASVRPEQTAFLSEAGRKESAVMGYSVKDSASVGLRGWG